MLSGCTFLIPCLDETRMKLSRAGYDGGSLRSRKNLQKSWQKTTVNVRIIRALFQIGVLMPMINEAVYCVMENICQCGGY